MKMKYKIGLLSILAIVMMSFNFELFAQSEIRVEVPNIVASDEQFNITFIIEGENKPSDFKWESGSDFQLIWGPQKGSSTSIRFINGKKSKSSQSTFTYVLMPKKVGKFTLPVASAKIKGKKIYSSNIEIEVLSSGSSANSSSSASSNSSNVGGSNPSTAQVGTISKNDLFLKLNLSRTNVVLGEPITAELKLYQKNVDIAGFEGAKFPVFNGFWSQEIETPQEVRFSRESVNNQIYYVAVLRKYVLIPQQSGVISIDPSELVCLVNLRVGASTGNSIFDSFFQSDYTTIRKRVTTPKITVKVKSLPANAPASFAGGVGKFDISASISKDSLKTHDAASLIIKVKGRGNVSLLTSPEVTFPLDFESYDVKTSQKVDKSGTRGVKTFEIPFIPRSSGDFTFEPIEYSYYDVDQHKYVTLKTAPLNINVAKGAEVQSTAEAGIPVIERTDVANLGADIRFIETKKPKFFSKGAFFYGSKWYWFIFILLSHIIGLGIVSMKKYQSRKSDIVGMKNRKATKMAKKRLKIAGELLKEDNYSEFYAELHKALLGYISDKLNMVAEEMSKENIKLELIDRSVSEETVDAFTSLLDACEFARYSPNPGNDALKEHYNLSIEAISQVDSMIKSKKSNHKVKDVNKVLSMVAVTVLTSLFLFASPEINATENNSELNATEKNSELNEIEKNSELNEIEKNSELSVSEKNSELSEAGNDYPTQLWNNAVQAYAEGQWKESIEGFENILALGIESSKLYYNIANAYFKNGNIPYSILNYERALKLDPSNSDARFNLDLANELIKDRIDKIPDFILTSWARDICYLLDSDAWAVISLIFLAIFGVLLAMFILSVNPVKRRIGFYCGILVLILGASAMSFARWQKHDYMENDTAIMVAPVSSVKSAPSSGSAKDLFILHEGTKVILLDQIGEWKNIQLSDGRQGWVRSDEMEVI